jgi:hypothetical protein
VRAEVIRLACERPADSDVPLARWSSAELAAEVVARGICEQISGVTVWRWLSEDAIKPWQHRSWIFPRDPKFTAKAGRILDLYSGRWEGELLHPGDCVLLRREALDPSPRAQAPNAPRRGRHQPRASASSTSTSEVARSATWPPDPRPHPGPRQLAQPSRDLLLDRPAQGPDPNDFPDLDTLEQQLLAFGRRYEQVATPFEWKFTRADLDRLAQRLDLPVAQAA